MTHTYATLEVSQAIYDEIAAKLREVGYDHVFMDDGAIDMHGIGLVPEPKIMPVLRAAGKVVIGKVRIGTTTETAENQDLGIATVIHGSGIYRAQLLEKLPDDYIAQELSALGQPAAGPQQELPYGFESGLVQLLNEARCLSKETVGNRQLASRIIRYMRMRGPAPAVSPQQGEAVAWLVRRKDWPAGKYEAQAGKDRPTWADEAFPLTHPAPAVERGVAEPECIGEIRSALDPKGRFCPTPGEWVADDHKGWVHPMTEVRTPETRDEGGHSIVRVHADFSCTVGKSEYEWANAAFVAACSPQNIRALLAYIDDLRAALTATGAAPAVERGVTEADGVMPNAMCVAQDVALEHAKDHGYLPQTRAEALHWKPHAWVLDAMYAYASKRVAVRAALTATGAAQGDGHGAAAGVGRGFDRQSFDLAGFTAALQRAMDARSKTAKEVSAETGVSETTLSRMKSAERAPDAASLAALSAWAGLNPASFCGSGWRSAQQEAPAAQPLTDAARDVLAERQRQIEVEGWTPEHDDEHAHGALSRASASYALAAAALLSAHPGVIQWTTEAAMQAWPWSADWWKPTDPRRMLIKAGALILAEIERLDRAHGIQPAGQAEMVCAEAYQVVGSLLSDVGQFDTELGGKILDNLSQARMVHNDVLPWPSFEPAADGAQRWDRDAALEAISEERTALLIEQHEGRPFDAERLRALNEDLNALCPRVTDGMIARLEADVSTLLAANGAQRVDRMSEERIDRIVDAVDSSLDGSGSDFRAFVRAIETHLAAAWGVKLDGN